MGTQIHCLISADYQLHIYLVLIMSILWHYDYVTKTRVYGKPAM